MRYLLILALGAVLSISGAVNASADDPVKADNTVCPKSGKPIDPSVAPITAKDAVAARSPHRRLLQQLRQGDHQGSVQVRRRGRSRQEAAVSLLAWWRGHTADTHDLGVPPGSLCSTPPRRQPEGPHGRSAAVRGHSRGLAPFRQMVSQHRDHRRVVGAVAWCRQVQRQSRSACASALQALAQAAIAGHPAADGDGA
jgi:hypothetical protein